MIHAYNKIYLNHARRSFACMLDCLVNEYQYSLSKAFDLFLSSDIAFLFGQGDISIIVGKSGKELAFEITNKQPDHKNLCFVRSKEYWVGWVLSYYQWYRDITFKDIIDIISIDEIQCMYDPFHEMDIRHFVDRMDDLFTERRKETKLKTLRKQMHMTQKELSIASNIPLRTIQQYEQRQKNINKAQVNYLYQLSKVLYCDIEDLLEKYIEEIK